MTMEGSSEDDLEKCVLLRGMQGQSLFGPYCFEYSQHGNPKGMFQEKAEGQF